MKKIIKKVIKVVKKVKPVVVPEEVKAPDINWGDAPPR